MASPKGKKGRRATHEEIPLVRRFIKADESMPVPVWRAVMYVTACQRGPVSQMIGPSFPPIEQYMRNCGVRDRRNARRYLDEAAESKWVERVDPGDGNAWHWYTLVPPEIESQIKVGDVPPDGYAEDDPRSRKKSRAEHRPKHERQERTGKRRERSGHKDDASAAPASASRGKVVVAADDVLGNKVLAILQKAGMHEQAEHIPTMSDGLLQAFLARIAAGKNPRDAW